jgi:hypothetical protein
MKHICSSCLSNLDTFEKDEDTVVVMPCEYCKMEELNLARMCNEKMETMIINRKIRLPNMEAFK